MDSSSSHFCTACQSSIPASDYKTHYSKSDWHRYNVKRRVAGLASISQSLFESQLAALHEKRQTSDKVKVDYSCSSCGKSFTSQAAHQSHLQSNKHIKKAEAKSKGKSEVEANHEDVSVLEKKVESFHVEEKKRSKEESEEEETSEGFEDWNDGDAIPLLTCLFCRVQHSDQQASLDHMLKEHGFFIPFVEFLTDLNGLIKYLGEKIGIGRVCLWCNGRGRARYPSVQAVQQHMKQKSHCKIRLDTEEEEEEFMDYYSFPKSPEELEEEKREQEEEERKKKNPYALPFQKESKQAENEQNAENVELETEEKPKRRLAGMNDLGELVLTDGSTVGHRQYKHVYRQNFKPAPEKDSQIIALMASSYRQLQLPGYNGTSTSTTVTLSRSVANNTKKDAPAGFREAWWSNAKRKDLLKVGMANNIQKHYRAQVQF
jgi:pre-60S factor REI1